MHLPLSRTWTSRLLALTVAALAAVEMPGGRVVAADKSQAQVIPVNASPHGATYSEWSARNWQWVFDQPTDHHPLFDTADISAGQTGKVWFLGGTFELTGTLGVTLGIDERTATIPTGISLFFPLVDSEDSDIEEGGPTTEDHLREVAKAGADAVDPDSLFCEVDGVPIEGLADFRVQSPLFPVGPLPDGNILQFFGLDVPQGTTGHAVSDGYFVMLPPLSAGEHTIHFGGEADFPDGSAFIEDITYHLTVAGN
jgi:hypothetical protein